MPPKRKKKKKLEAPLESVESLLKAIQQDIDCELSKDEPDPDVIEGLRARQLQGERLRAHIELSNRKMNVSLVASHEWRELSAALSKEMALCTCGARGRVLKLLSDD